MTLNGVCFAYPYILTFQGHPEFVPAYAQAIMNFRSDIIGEDVYEACTASPGEAPERERIGRWILAFLASATAGPYRPVSPALRRIAPRRLLPA